jgi:hypothetical protein
MVKVGLINDWGVGKVIRVLSDTLSETPTAGTLEFSNDRMYLTNVSTQRAIDRTNSVVTATETVTNTTTETTVYTSAIPANSGKAGNVFAIRASGAITNDSAADEVTIRYKVGGNTIATIVSPGNTLSDDYWHIEAVGTLRSVGVSGEYAYRIRMVVCDGCEAVTGIVTSVDTTQDNDVTITAEWNNAKTGNIFNLYQGYTTYKN